jgi:hypothetical protein
MVDGFLLFTILDVWRMVLPLGLTLIVCVTEVLHQWQGSAHYAGIRNVLSLLAFRLTVSLFLISGVVGLLVPSVLGYPMPESHIALGPWGYEEILGFVLGGGCLWRSCQGDVRGMKSRLVWMGFAAAVFLGVGVLWIGRWDAMANGGNVPGGWFMLELSSLEWTRVVPKTFHLLFSTLAAGGVMVTLLGLLGWVGGPAGPSSSSGVQPIPSSDVIRYGVGWILSGVVPQMLIGPWLFLVLGEVPRGGLIDGAGMASALFFLSVMAALVALVLLNASFMVPHVKGLVWGGLISVVITLVVMGMIRYVMFLATLHSQGIPIAIGSVTPFHLLTVLVLTGLLGAILVRWCVRPLTILSPRPLSNQRLDKRYSAN